MKKNLMSLIILVIVLSLTGCGIKDKIEQKAGEALTEKILEETSGGDVDIDGDEVTIKGEDGEEWTMGSTEWPTSELSESIPEFKEGKVTSVINSDGVLWITVETVKTEGATAYFDEVKELFAQETAEMNSDDMISFSGKNDEGFSVSLIYSEELLTITVMEPQQ